MARTAHEPLVISVSATVSGMPPGVSPPGGSPDAVSNAAVAALPISHGKPPVSPPSLRTQQLQHFQQQPHHGLKPRMTVISPGAVSPSPPVVTRLPSLSRNPQAIASNGAAYVLTSTPTPTPTPSSFVYPPPSPVRTTDTEPTPHELAARLALLLHARECCTPLDQERVCGVRNCRVARGVLDHCQECFLAEGACHRSCAEAKRLLRHFRVCQSMGFARQCVICDALRSDFAWALEHARSLTPLLPTPSPRDPTPSGGGSTPQSQYPPRHYHTYSAQLSQYTPLPTPPQERRVLRAWPGCAAPSTAATAARQCTVNEGRVSETQTPNGKSRKRTQQQQPRKTKKQRKHDATSGC